MIRIEQIDILMVDLVLKVKRTDAIQSFVSQETRNVCIRTSDGAEGIGYSYTVGTGGRAVVDLPARRLVPRLIDRDPAMIEQI